MTVYISFYKATDIDINKRRSVNVVKHRLINDLRRRIRTPIKTSHRALNVDTSYIQEMETYRISSIPTKKKNIKWLRKASCKQIIKFAHEVDLWLFGDKLYKELNINFPIKIYLEEDKYNNTFKNSAEFFDFIEKESLIPIKSEHKDIIVNFFKEFDNKGLIQIF